MQCYKSNRQGSLKRFTNRTACSIRGDNCETFSSTEMDFSAPQIVSLTQYWTYMVLVWTCMARTRILLRIDLSRSFLAVGLRQKAYSDINSLKLGNGNK